MLGVVTSLGADGITQSKCEGGSQRRTKSRVLSTQTSKVTGEPTTLSVCLPPECPDTEEPANLESFGGEDPRPELYLSSGFSLPSPCPCPPACPEPG